MSEWHDNKKQSSGNFRQLLKEQIEKANPRRELSAEEAKRLSKLEAIADKLKRGENVQNRQLQTWLSEEEYAHNSITIFHFFSEYFIRNKSIANPDIAQCL